MGVPGRRPTGKPTRDRNPRVHDWTVVADVPFTDGEPLPEDHKWPAATVRWWAAVSSMPHCRLWHASDWSFAQDTALIAAAFHGGTIAAAAELRLREKKLGMTLEDRMSLRLRYVDPAALEKSASAGVTSLDDYRDL